MPDDQERLWTEMHIQHLQMLQGVIARMASNSASLKNYCMTISAAIIGPCCCDPKTRNSLLHIATGRHFWAA